jgi:hypothetical protein
LTFRLFNFSSPVPVPPFLGLSSTTTHAYHTHSLSPLVCLPPAYFSRPSLQQTLGDWRKQFPLVCIGRDAAVAVVKIGPLANWRI